MNNKTRSSVHQVLLTRVDSEEAASSELAILLHITLHLTSHINSPHISIRNRHIYRQPPAKVAVDFSLPERTVVSHGFFHIRILSGRCI